MEHYVTLFDSLFLPQGVALYRSMQRNLGDFVLWVLCMDDESERVLRALDFPHMRLLHLADWETTGLLSAKAERTRGEYCWTLTPFSIRFVFESDSTVTRVTYLDADLWFRRAPDELFAELDNAGKSVLITEHAYAAEYDQTDTSGIYCVQFMTFTRSGGEPVRKWWEDRCLEWCYARSEDGKFGDQKYLDDWPTRFPDQVHVLSDRELALAPWNATRFPIGKCVFYHFHCLRIVSDATLFVGKYRIPQQVIERAYRPYIADLKGASAAVLSAGGSVRPQAALASPASRVRDIFSRLVSSIRHSGICDTLKW